MKKLTLTLIGAMLIAGTSFKTDNFNGDTMLYPELAKTFKIFKRLALNISYDKQDQLMGITQIVIVNQIAKKKLNIEIADVDNSFQSQLAQIILKVALVNNGINNVNVYSAGTATATLNPLVEKQLSRMGFKVEQASNGLNVKYADGVDAVLLYPKTINDTNLPSTDVIHVALCVQGGACPFAADHRTTKLFYNFPNPGTEAELEYEANKIGSDMVWVAKKIKEVIKN